MENKDKIKSFQNRVSDAVDFVYKDLVFPDIFIQQTAEKENIRTQIDRLEYKKFTEDWIVNIESFFPSLNQIIRNLRNTLKYEEEILPIERTRRTNTQSIRHLLRNTRYIREVNEDDEIIPNRILNTVSEIDYGIYENRFIMTLIDRLYFYLLNRLELIKQHMHGFKQTNFKLKNEFKIDNADYTLKFELNAKEEFDSTLIDEHNKRIYDRTSEAYKIVSRMYHSDFMRTMSRYQKVKAPILKTQIILKNPDFKNAYMLWLLLDRLNALDYTLEQRLEQNKFKEEYLDQIDKSLMMLFSTIFINSDLGVSIFDERNVKLESIKPIEEDILEYANGLDVIVPKMIVEPNLSTEYHLEKAKREFAGKYHEKLKVIKDDQESLKQIILDQYSIADQIFNSYLNLDQDDDVFSQMLSYNDPVKRYEEAFDKYNITKGARQVKEEIYLNSIILEDRWIKELLELQKHALTDIERKERIISDEVLRKLQREYNKELALIEQEEIEKTRLLIEKQKMENESRIEELKDKHEEEVRGLKILEQERLEQAKRELAAKALRDQELLKARLEEERKLALEADLEEELRAQEAIKEQELIDARIRSEEELKLAVEQHAQALENERLRVIALQKQQELLDAKIRRDQELKLAEEQHAKALEEQRLKTLEVERLKALEEQKLKDLEIKRLKALEEQKLKDLEEERLKVIAAQKEKDLEIKKLKDLEDKRLKDLETQRLNAIESQRLKMLELNRLKAIEEEKQKALAKARIDRENALKLQETHRRQLELEANLTAIEIDKKVKNIANLSETISMLKNEYSSNLPVNERVIELYDKSMLAKSKERDRFENLNLKELRTLARSMELVGYSKYNKPDLIRFIFTNSDLSKLSLDELNDLARKLNLEEEI